MNIADSLVKIREFGKCLYDTLAENIAIIQSTYAQHVAHQCASTRAQFNELCFFWLAQPHPFCQIPYSCQLHYISHT